MFAKVTFAVLVGGAALLVACGKTPVPPSGTNSSFAGASPAATTPASSPEASKPAVATPDAKESGSVIGGSAGGNTTSPSSTSAGESAKGGYPQPTGGDASPKAAEQGAEKAKK